jgi:branched-chain amino acid transport system ATP-binding protein
MTKPRLLLLDEPSMGLAPILIETVFATIERVARGGMTVLLVEQNAEAALAIAARAYIMERGAIVLDGAAASIANDPRVQNSYLGVA